MGNDIAVEHVLPLSVPILLILIICPDVEVRGLEMCIRDRFSDMTHEGASSIRGAYLSLLGASAGTIGFVSGLGELIGYSMRYVFGKLTDKTKQYWPMTIAGYVLDIIAVPALALVGEHGSVSYTHLDVYKRQVME